MEVLPVRGVGRGDTSLAKDLFVSSFAVVTVAVVLLAVTAVTGVYRTVRDLEQHQLAAECASLGSGLRAHLRAAGDVLDGIVSGTDRASEGLTSRQWVAGFEHFDRLLLVSGSGEVVSSYPRSAKSDGVPTQLVGKYAEVTVFTYTGFDDRTGEPIVWAARTIDPETGDFVAGRVRTRFLADMVRRSVERGTEDRLACISCDNRLMAVAGGTTARASGIMFSAGATSGTGEARLDGTSVLVGNYADVSGTLGLSWRVAVLTPRSAILRSARSALTPAAIAAVLVSTLAIVGATVSGRLMVAPLRELERRALRASSGAYVRPIESKSRYDEVGRLSTAINDLTSRLNALHDISRLLSSAARTEQVLDRILSAVAHIAPSARAAVFLTDMVSGDLVAERLPAGSAMQPGYRLAVESSQALWQALLAEGPASLPPDAVYEAAFGQPGELLAVPLGVSGEPFGLLMLCAGDSPFSDAEIETLGTFGAQAAVALRNSRLFEAEYASRLEAEALREVAEQLADPTDLGTALDSVSEVAGRLMGADRTVLAVRRRDAYGLPPAEDPRREAALLDVLALAGSSGAIGAIVAEDVTERHFGRPYAGLGVRSLIVVPLSAGDDVTGGIGFEYADGSVWFGEVRLGLANTIAKQVSLALANAFLFAQAQRRAANLDTIFRISQAVGSSLDTNVVLDRVLDVVQKIFSADAVSLMRYDTARKTLVTAMARGLVSREILELTRRPGEDVAGEVFEHRRPRVIGSLDAGAGGVESLAVSRGLQSLACVPLLARGRSIGVITVFSREAHAYKEEDIELLSTFASQAALAIDTAALYGREHTVASTLQSSILPDRLPRIRGIDADSVYSPAGKDAEIGGDYYDLFETADGRVILVMCDVCGKGVDAATKTSMVKYSVRALAATGSGPGEIVTEVNRIVAETGDTADIVTLMVASLDRSDGLVTYSNGGHPPGLLLRPGEAQPVRLSATGPLLGAVSSAIFEEVAEDVPQASIILMYTDGVTEARRGNRFFGEKRVRRALMGGGSASAVTRRIVASLRRFTPGDLRDDVAILTVRSGSGDERLGARS